MATQIAIPTAVYFEVIATVIGPWLLLHFFLILPDERSWLNKNPLLYLIYVPPVVTLILFPLIGYANGQPVPEFRNIRFLEVGLGLVAVAGVAIFNYIHASSVRTHQQMKIILITCLAALIPFLVIYLLPQVVWKENIIPPGFSILFIGFIPIGGCRNSTGNSPTDKLFTGQRLDSTGLYYYNARYYDPYIGRFISPDIFVQDYTNPQTLNRYAYCQNNPLRYTDPSGHFSWGLMIGCVAIGLVVAVACVATGGAIAALAIPAIIEEIGAATTFTAGISAVSDLGIVSAVAGGCVVGGAITGGEIISAGYKKSSEQSPVTTDAPKPSNPPTIGGSTSSSISSINVSTSSTANSTSTVKSSTNISISRANNSSSTANYSYCATSFASMAYSYALSGNMTAAKYCWSYAVAYSAAAAK